MVARCLICLLIIVPGYLLAEFEIPETRLEEIEDNLWEQTFPEQDQRTTSPGRLQGYSTFRYQNTETKDSFQAQNQISYQSKLLDLRFNHRHEPLKEHYNIGLGISPGQGPLQKLVLGSYRVQFGRGIVTGFSRKHDTGSALAPASNPARYTPWGAGAQLGTGSLKALFFASAQERGISTSDSLISSLASSRSSRLASTRESILGAAIGYEAKGLQIGAMYYHQAYDKAFAPAARAVYEEAVSLALGLRDDGLVFSSETALLNREIAGFYALGYAFGGLRHQVCYARFPSVLKPAYSVNVFETGVLAPRDEISYQLSARLGDSFTSKLDLALGNRRDRISSAELLSRTILELDFKERQSRHNLRFIRLDRELLSFADSVFQDTNPEHYRVHYRFSHKLNGTSSLTLKASYAHEEKGSLDKNSFWWDSAYSNRTKSFSWKLGLSTWHTQNHIYVLGDDSAGNEAYSILKGSALSSYFDLRYNYQRMSIGLFGKQVLNRDGAGSIGLSVRGSL